jgi:Family of unknown function (DUF6049)
MPRQRSTHRDRRPARTGRLGRCLAALAVLVIATGGSVLAAGSQAAAADGPSQVSITILSVSPQVARPGQRVTVTGTVSNPTGSAVSNLAVTLWASPFRFTTRSEMDSYAAGHLQADAPVAGAVTLLPGSLAPGATQHWTVTARPANLHLTQFGVYPLAAQVTTTTTGQPLDAQRTFLPFWPGSAAKAGLAQREKLAWVWPLIAQPQQQACAALLTDDLAGNLSATGRLGRLLADGSAPAASAADLTWAIDPSLVASATTMTMKHGYRVGGTPACAGAAGRRASAAAGAWLRQLSLVTARQDFFTTPYADVDSSALTHAGLGDDLHRAYLMGRATAQDLLGGVQRPGGQLGQVAWPAAGIADYAVLSALAANGIGTVILNSSLMPPATPAGYTPSAITTTLNGVNAGMHVALADSTLSQLLADAPTASANRPAAGSFATEQRFLAETAMIAAEQPRLPRTVVVTPPRQWNPARGLARELLTETVQAPWLRPASLARLVTARPPAGQVRRAAPPRLETGHGELRKSLLHKLKGVENGIRLQASIMPNESPASYLAGAVATVQSSAWRGEPAKPRALLGRITGYLDAQWRQVRIVGSGQDTLTGKSGSVPVSINNKLNQPVTVRLRVWAPSGRITIDLPPKPVVIGQHQQRTVAVRVHAATPGSTVLKLQLLAPDGHPLPGTQAQLTVDATHFGRTATVIIAVAIGVFVITAAARAVRRRNRAGVTAGGGPGAGPDEDANGADPAGSPGGSPGLTDTVVTERAHDNHTPEEPDEYASAPGRLERPR